MEGHLRVNTLFIGDNVRQAVQEGRADFTPVLLSEFPLLFKKWLFTTRCCNGASIPTRRTWFLQFRG